MPIVLQPKDLCLHIIIQELGKFDFKVSVIPDGLEKHMSLNINYKLIFTDSFQFSSSSLDNLVKNSGKDGFKYLIQKVDGKALDLVQRK